MRYQSHGDQVATPVVEAWHVVGEVLSDNTPVEVGMAMEVAVVGVGMEMEEVEVAVVEEVEDVITEEKVDAEEEEEGEMPTLSKSSRL